MRIRSKIADLSHCIMLLLLATTLQSCSSNDDSKPVPAITARNIILFIGDGMDEEHRKAARWLSVGKAGRLAMDDMPVSGLLETYSASSDITDSAAAATAMATGVKTNNRVIGMDAGLNVLPTILEEAQQRGKSVGLVTTTQIAHATPAAFAAHVVDRSLMLDIAEQMLAANVDVLLGGGEDEFLPDTLSGCYPQSGERTDTRNLVAEAQALGYMTVCDQSAFDLLDPVATDRLLGLFADEGMIRPFAPSLASMTSKAIAILAHQPKGFFLMVEGGQIDWASHLNDAENTIADTVALDEAVTVAKRFAAAAGDTLIIVTADHETGGMTVSEVPGNLPGQDGPFTSPDGSEFYVNWSTTGHTAVNVTVTAQGPSAYRFAGTNDNTLVHDIIIGAL